MSKGEVIKALTKKEDAIIEEKARAYAVMSLKIAPS